jgi:hypothetical protein
MPEEQDTSFRMPESLNWPGMHALKEWMDRMSDLYRNPEADDPIDNWAYAWEESRRFYDRIAELTGYPAVPLR